MFSFVQVSVQVVKMDNYGFSSSKGSNRPLLGHTGGPVIRISTIFLGSHEKDFYLNWLVDWCNSILPIGRWIRNTREGCLRITFNHWPESLLMILKVFYSV